MGTCNIDFSTSEFFYSDFYKYETPILLRSYSAPLRFAKQRVFHKDAVNGGCQYGFPAI
jgi:hypothetical protein